MPKWRNSHKNPPKVGEKIYYYGPEIGLWVGHYKYKERVIKSKKVNPDVHLCPHIFYSDAGVVDACDAPFWHPYDAERPKSWCPIPPKKYVKEK